jgi:hypothetical protein
MAASANQPPLRRLGVEPFISPHSTGRPAAIALPDKWTDRTQGAIISYAMLARKATDLPCPGIV